MNQRHRLMFAAAALVTAATLGGCNKAPTPVMSAATPASANVSDQDVTEHVRTALQQNEGLKGFNITVETLKGDVRLNGMVDTQAQIDEAIGIARASDGVHAIHDELTIKK